MKTLIVSLVALVFAFFVGCQDTITDPVVQDQASYNNSIYKDVISTWPGYIKVHHTIFDPSHPQLNNVLLNGMIRYKLEPNVLDQSAENTDMKVSLYVDIEIRGACPDQKSAPFVKAFAYENIKMSTTKDTPYFVDKSFRVSNSCSGRTNLNLKFAVERNKVTLFSYSLSVVD